MYGIVELREALLRYIDHPLDSMVERIVEELTEFRGEALVKDDQTLLALDFVGDDKRNR
jgi:serine phosphatase RsbU (regulator of sigma subunit)